MKARITRIVLKIIVLFFGITFLITWIYRYIPIYLTPLMVIRYITSDDPRFYHTWVSIEEISKPIQKAVISSEDQLFPYHNGFDVKSMKKAFIHNSKGGHIKGGSTISQQTAKNVFLWPNRSWLRKGLETYFTFLIETLWPKERILEVYLNSIEMGTGIYGIEAASHFWFHKSARVLNSQEAAAIAAILPNPRRYLAHPPTAYIQKKIQWITQQMRSVRLDLLY